MSPSIESRRVASELTRTEFVLQGGRYHLLLLTEGSGRISGAGCEQALSARSVAWLPNGKARTVTLDAGTGCCLISLPDEAIGRAIGGDTLGNLVRQVVGLTHHFSAIDESALRTLTDQGRLLEVELKASLPGIENVLGNAVATILVCLWRLSGAELTQPLAVPRNLVHSFTALVDLHLRDHWSVGRYAKHLGITRDRLTAIIRRATGKTPLAVIHARMIDEAKLLLNNSNQQVAEIAFTLGFEDPAYFNRFFQRHLGMPPARYRREHQRIAAGEESSFAAWP